MKNYFIPQDFIKEIINQTNIVEIIQQHIKLIKNGNNYYAICPFHNEKNPSFYVNIEKQYFYCFGCHINGNVIHFLMKYNQLTFLESIKELTKQLNIKIPNQYIYTKNIKYHQQNIFIYKILKNISQIYHNNIHSTNGNIAQVYLKKRNINLHIINKFELGFSSQKIFNTKKIINDYNQDLKNYIKENILNQNTYHNKYDLFYNRIIFPIKNQYGYIIGFAGRAFLNKHTPKYINSCTTKIFNKKNQLYGIDKIHEKNTILPYILVVEGYFDVISLHQFNITNVVASLGTMITSNHIKTLFNITNNIIYCYDGDIAGKTAAWKAVKKTLPHIQNNQNVKFISLPNQEDPDSLIHKEGQKKFNYRIKHAIHITDFFFKILMQKIDLYTTEGKNKLCELAIPFINIISNQFLKIIFKKKLGEKIGILDTFQIEKLFYKEKKYYHNYCTKPNNIRILINLILTTPKIVQIIPFSLTELKKIKIFGIPLFIEIFEICQTHNNIQSKQLTILYKTKQKKYNIIKKLLTLNNMIEQKKKKYVFIDLIIKLFHIILEKKYNNLIFKDRNHILNIKEKHILLKINKTLKNINI